ncbi:histidine phosphatase family protein [Stackebrandtia soli]|uniref:histidine phosphatase family protein n=1 Tax=Stackebrandtia soli TaxID=1892856 RepID=UPI0039EB1CA9
MSRIIVLRHGRTEWNDLGKFQGAVDVALDDVGRSQAEAAAVVLAQLPITVVVSSDLSRALETATVVANRLGVGVRIDERLRERAYGPWEGLTRAEIEAKYPDEFVAWQRREPVELPGIEDRDVVAERGGRALAEVADAVRPGEVALVSSHGATSRQALGWFLGWTPEQTDTVFGLSNCHWADLRSTPSGWRLHGYNLSAM